VEGREIPLPARIVSVADVYDALTHRRSYKPAIPKEKSIAMMRKFSGSSFDPDILEVFLDIFDSGDGDDK
jgi:HD-GYP domain-containing protein (c-di-GMP phosphodiesterase class II)